MAAPLHRAAWRARWGEASNGREGPPHFPIFVAFSGGAIWPGWTSGCRWGWRWPWISEVPFWRIGLRQDPCSNAGNARISDFPRPSNIDRSRDCFGPLSAFVVIWACSKLQCFWGWERAPGAAPSKLVYFYKHLKRICQSRGPFPLFSFFGLNRSLIWRIKSRRLSDSPLSTYSVC